MLISFYKIYLLKENQSSLGNNDCYGTEALSYGLETVDWYTEAKKKGYKIVGTWNYSNPVLLLVDLDTIKSVLVKVC